MSRFETVRVAIEPVEKEQLSPFLIVVLQNELVAGAFLR
jgi:hypothetical protein